MEAGRERERGKTPRARRRRKREKNSLSLIQFSFLFLHNLCFHGNHTIWEEMGEQMYRSKRRRHTTGLQVEPPCRGRGEGEARQRLGSLFLLFVHRRAEFRCLAARRGGKITQVSLAFGTRRQWGLTAGCRYPQRMVPLTPDNSCQLY